jgi:hypothetical protein
MAIQQPSDDDKTNLPGHALSHRVFANDDASAVKAVVVDASNNVLVGDGGTTNYNKFDSGGYQTLFGTAQGELNLRPSLVDNRTKLSDNVPTEITRGCNIGYSFPVYNSDGEELFFKMRISGRWNGTDDPQFGVAVTLIAGEDVGDKFKFQLEWQTTNKGNVMGTTTSNCTSEQVVLTGRNDANDTYFIWFTLDASDATNPIEAGNMLQGRLRRIASASPAITGEVGVWDWSSVWKTNRIFTVASVKTNDA